MNNLELQKLIRQARLDEINRILAESPYRGDLAMVLEGRLVAAELAAIERQIKQEQAEIDRIFSGHQGGHDPKVEITQQAHKWKNGQITYDDQELNQIGRAPLLRNQSEDCHGHMENYGPKGEK